MIQERKRDSKGQRIIIIGNGIAGNSAALAIRKFDKDVDVVLLSDEKEPLYSPCAFHKYLAGEMESQKLFLKKVEDYSREGIRIIWGKKVGGVDPIAKEVGIEDTRIRFDKLILATGSKALFPPIKGVDKRGVFALKTMDDVRSIFHYPARKVVVVGSGPIGIEAAAAFRRRGLEVTLIEILNRLMPRLFDEAPSSFLREIIEGAGIKVLTEEKAEAILGNGAVQGVATDRREIGCDMVVMGAGVRPNSGLAKKAGLEIGRLGGIKTDDYMMTTMENIYACGDCVESKDIVTGEAGLSLLWPNAKRQGWVSGCNCAGEQRRFPGSFDATNLEISGTYALSAGRGAAGLAGRKGYEVIEKRDGSSYYRLVIVDNRLLGIQLINKIEHGGLLFSKMVRKDDIVGLARAVFDDKLLAVRPWNYWLGRYLAFSERRKL